MLLESDRSMRIGGAVQLRSPSNGSAVPFFVDAVGDSLATPPKQPNSFPDWLLCR